MLKLFTLISGKEVMGKVVKQDSDTIVLESPVVIQIIPQSKESYGIGLYPYSPTDPSGSRIFYINNIESECITIPSDLEKTYIQETTGISIVTSFK